MLPIPGAGDAWKLAIWDALANGASGANRAIGANANSAFPRALPPKEFLLKANITVAMGEAASATPQHAVADGITHRGRNPIGEPGHPPGRACERTNLVRQRFAKRVELLV